LEPARLETAEAGARREQAGRHESATPICAPRVDDALRERLVDTLAAVAAESGAQRDPDRPQLAAAAYHRRQPVIGVSSEAQLRHNGEAVGWTLDPTNVRRLDGASAFPERNRPIDFTLTGALSR